MGRHQVVNVLGTSIFVFFITDRVNMKEVEIKWCPTKDMVADFMIKPLQGSHFRRLRDLITGMTSIKRSKNPTLSSVKLKKRKKKAKRSVIPS
jgi:hypothetical protein